MKPMKASTVELPRLKRMPERNGGHVIYGIGEVSICPEHKFCAYTGDEPNRCHFCHADHPTDEHGDYPPGRVAPCLCPLCDELFSSKTATTLQRRPDGRCYKPERRGLVLVNKNDWLIWANPGDRPDDI